MAVTHPIAAAALTCVLAVAGPALQPRAASAQPIAPLDTSATDPITLRYAYRPGETVRYRVSVDGEFSISDISTAREWRVGQVGTFVVSLVVQQRNDDGNVVIIEEITNPDFELTTEGIEIRESQLRDAYSGVARTVELEPSGRLVDEEIQSNDEVPGLGNDSSMARRPGRLVRFRLPEDPIEIGDSWLSEDESTLPGGFAVTSTMMLQYLGSATVEGRRCVVLKVSGERWVELPEGQEIGVLVGPALGRGVREGYIYFDARAGRVVRVDMQTGTVGRADGSATSLDFMEQESLSVVLD